MSEQVTQEMDKVPKREVGIDSLRERLAGRTEEVQRKYTKVWPIPGLQDMVAVELRMLSYREARMISKVAERERDEYTGELYSYADQIIRATEGFHLIDEHGEMEPITGATWMDVARSMPGSNLPEDLTPRRAVFAIIPEYAVFQFFGEWLAWQKAGGRDVGEEVMRDFETTP